MTATYAVRAWDELSARGLPTEEVLMGCVVAYFADEDGVVSIDDTDFGDTAGCARLLSTSEAIVVEILMSLREYDEELRREEPDG